MSYSIKYLTLYFLLSALFLSSLAQDYDKRAVKLAEKGEAAVKMRDFPNAKKYFTKSLEADATYPKPYIRLATIYRLYQQPDSAVQYFNMLVENVKPSQLPESLWRKIAAENYATGNYEMTI